MRRPVDLFEDRQLLEGGGMVETRLADGRTVPLPKIPLRMSDHDFGLRRQTPAIGEGAREFLGELGYGDGDIAKLIESDVLVIDEAADAKAAPDSGMATS